MILFLAPTATAKNLRPLYNVRERMDWDAHAAKLFRETPLAFYREYRMGYASFLKLCSRVNLFVRVDVVYSGNRANYLPILREP